ncbi:hypothetical protein ABZ299_30335 [Streptomyces sp. NPDC006184]|uniref:hypothetical protein n=1 Tax=Streptomyces sp. NPDC006184 TaxID=3155455 RepID=UPI0033A22997
MSGFVRDPKYYGDRLVYEPLERKWAGYHAQHCGCGRDWLEAHAVPAGFTVILRGRTGYYGLVGPGLTEGVDEEKLTPDALWEAVTGKPGAQTSYESVHITCRSPDAEAADKAENERIYAPRRERAEKAKTESATEAQVKYLTTLAEKVGKERFDAEFAKVIKGSDIPPRAPRQRCATAAKRLTKARARKLITALVGHDQGLPADLVTTRLPRWIA